MISAIAPGLVTFGLALAILPWLRREQIPARLLMIAVGLILLVQYAAWRIFHTMPPAGWTAEFIVGLIFIIAEVASLIASALSMIFLARTRDRRKDVDANLAWLASRPAALVDVFICTYNEEASILERTMIGATGMTYPNYRVWVLDDGKRDWLKVMAERLGCHYLTRRDNSHAKAGNINNALAHVAQLETPPDFISILDADFVTMPTFLTRAMSLFRDEGVGVVQTPQHFINPDPIQTNLGTTEVWPDEQRYFFDILMPAKDGWGAAFCCGTSSVIRFAPLRAIGGFPTDSVTEDYLLTLRMKEIGARTVYLNERLTIGLAPEGLKEYITQRGRWCLGFMQICRGRSGPFSLTSRLDFIDRLSLVDSFMSWTSVYIAKVLGLIVPTLFLLLGIRAVHADLPELLRYFLPFYVWHSITMAWISRGRSLAIMSDITQYIAAPAIIRAVFTGLLKPQGHKFSVTAKGGDRNQRFVEWPILRIYAPLLILTLAGIAYAFVLNLRGEAVAYGGLALAWSLYNAVILTIVCFVCIEQPRRRKAERFDRDEPILVSTGEGPRFFRLIDISITGAGLRGELPAPPGSRIVCNIQGQRMPATIVRRTPGGFAIRFDETLDERIKMIRAFYAGDYVSTYRGIRAAPVGKAIFMRIFN
jgi:cellulose synthase (UDP-forming)